MSDLNIKNDYYRKLVEFVVPEIQNIQNLDILEFGVRKGISTSIFLNICKKNNGRLFSNDVDNFSWSDFVLGSIATNMTGSGKSIFSKIIGFSISLRVSPVFVFCGISVWHEALEVGL